ncbi:hypothetical protein [Streptomyces roseochromogenus]|uniref:hypothetical protein n=1 Tax=Streptomyces roseochromogenus TaxID=285450 RepID=UPI000D115180|nr:hypothetical protein [Streptomyces roseochromogenus]
MNLTQTGAASVAVMFVILTVALWLRPLNYAYWAAGVTTAPSLLLGYFGQNAADVLPTRLAAIALGATPSIAGAWFLLPVSTPAPALPFRGSGGRACAGGRRSGAG